MSAVGAKAALYTAALCLLGCKSPRATPPSPSAAPSTVATPTPTLKPLVAPAPIEAPDGCRAIALTGSVQSRSSALSPQARLDGVGFLDVASGARVVAKHTRSGRELTVEGPALVEFCRNGEERVLLVSGRFRGTTGVGARPGAEVWVATPAGVIRYGDADLSVQADAKKVELSVNSGDAWIEAAHGATLKGPERVVPKGKARLSRGANSTADALVTHCERTAKIAADAARLLLSGPAQPGGDAGTLGERAAAQVRARRAARAACASAAAALGQVKDLAEQSRLTTRLEQAEQLWRLVPPQKSTAQGLGSQP